jgi:uncharacterized protein CbrC (UPF0167 family)
MDEPLPSFRYHPDPLSTGSFKPDADTPCLSCNRLRGYLYTGSVWTEKNFILDDHLCPWCIADGSAARRFGATFNYTGTLDDVSDEAREEIEMRTPGFHCLAAGSLARLLWRWLPLSWDLTGAKELREQFADAVGLGQAGSSRGLPSCRRRSSKIFWNSLSTEADPTAYIFRCLHCGKYLSYVDQA